ncbi:MAG: cob(I)yrinic acid a,c-diamide adenosyltransferase [Ignavibacterium sp.]|nr:cob(I)yrinic acid a,c-diamide adenosyltransferase [Ignavibacterium sp.]MDW8375146.1 cob(I)yrinic acid a,c-diamide adenosyltransferase [Ignavibacteriales bacterium]
MRKLKKGYIQIYTGNGKGKTTAAIGQVVRAAGFGLKSYLACFMKEFPYSEFESLKKFEGLIKVESFGKDDFVYRREYPKDEELQAIRLGLDKSKDAMIKEKYDLIVLDEICVCHYFKIFSVDEIIDFIKLKPENTELILTGRYCPQELFEYADLITEMKEIKHYYSQGVNARRGIES